MKQIRVGIGVPTRKAAQALAPYIEAYGSPSQIAQIQESPPRWGIRAEWRFVVPNAEAAQQLLNYAAAHLTPKRLRSLQKTFTKAGMGKKTKRVTPKTPVDEAGWHDQIVFMLKRAGVSTVGDVMERRREHGAGMGIPRMGPQTRRPVEDTLVANGLLEPGG